MKDTADKEKAMAEAKMKTPGTAAQPSVTEWKFIDDLQAPLHQQISLPRLRRRQGEADFSGGVRLDFNFPGANLDTAYQDFRLFLTAADIRESGDYRICTAKISSPVFESFRIEISADSCRILAGDTEGIRRGLVYVEDEILRNEGPFLKQGIYERKPFIKTRISRCFFGPIKRPPFNRDELADDVDYYPTEYLNRLSHESVNGLWLTVSFRDLCPSKYFPSHGKDAERRLEKLRQTVSRCAKYGIKIYLFCIEPAAFGDNPERVLPRTDLRENDYFRGHSTGGITYFCTSSPEGQEYLEECAYYLFSEVSGLGGLIDINLGERATHCYSSRQNFFENNCPRCSQRKPWEVFNDTTAALARGMHRASPSSEMISWLYGTGMYGKTEQEIESVKRTLLEIAAHPGDGVTMQYNFEAGGRAFQLGKERILGDYWLAWPGPSRFFSESALRTVERGARVSAKIQTGCSHEVATVPFVPVPGNLYAKYSNMRNLKVNSVMQCWYFGNYPGLMNKAAGELSFEPFPPSEKDFLLKMAAAEWGRRHAGKVTAAWEYFKKGYSHFPYNVNFTWYGPVHNSVVWPLYLFPADKPISPSWKFDFPQESGDRIGECLCYGHTLEEALLLLERMSVTWERGVEILNGLEKEFLNVPERLLDIGLARALGIQFSSAYNVFLFYSLREKLPRKDEHSQSAILLRMRRVVENEIANSLELKSLCNSDARLGFHSEAEGYKYSPALLEKRVELLRKLLEEEFAVVEKQIQEGEEIFPEYTGAAPRGKVYRAPSRKESAMWETLSDGATAWRSWHKNGIVYFEVKEHAVRPDSGAPLKIRIEPCRLWPAQTFSIEKNGATHHRNFQLLEDGRWNVEISSVDGLNTTLVRVPLSIFAGYHRNEAPLRVNLIIGNSSWTGLNPLPERVLFGTDNPADLGWFFLD